jgi:hypothetical protein
MAISKNQKKGIIMDHIRRADSCPVSADYAEVRVNDRVITSYPSLDLLVPDEFLFQGCIDMLGNPPTRPFLPDSECRMGCGRLQCDIGMM